MSNPRSQIQILKLKNRLKSFAVLVVILSFLFCILRLNNVFASLKINEIYPAPQSEEYEWIEIYNFSSSSADLSNYIFDDDSDFNSDSGSGTKISLSGILLNNSICYWKLSNYLNNTGDQPTLFNKDGDLIDTYSYKNAQIGKSYSRIPDGGEWQINVDPTKVSLSCFDLIPTPTSTLTPTPTLMPTIAPTSTPTVTPEVSSEPTKTPTSTPVFYNNIYISEVMIYPESGNNEWIELYNDNDFTVFLTDWYIDDLENGGSTPRKFSLEIPSKSYKVFNLISSIFNNSGDNVRLLDQEKNLKDSFEYNSSTQGKTLGRNDFFNDNFCSQEPSYELLNNSCLNPTSTSTPIITTPVISTQIKSPTTPKITPKLKYFDVSTLPAGRQVHRSITYPTAFAMKNLDDGNVLGISSFKPNNNFLVHILSFVSFSYSLLTIMAILSKMKFVYGKSKAILSSFIYSGGNK